MKERERWRREKGKRGKRRMKIRKEKIENRKGRNRGKSKEPRLLGEKITMDSSKEKNVRKERSDLRSQCSRNWIISCTTLSLSIIICFA